LSLAKIRYLQKVLANKYGVKGKAAGIYVEAGYRVNIDFPTKKGIIHIYAIKGSDRVVAEVLWESKKIGTDTVESLAEKAKILNARPVLIIYGEGPILTEEAKSKAEELGILIKRIRRT